MLNPWRSKHHVSEPSENSTSGNEDQDLRGGKRHKPNADREVGNHEVMKPTLPENPNPISIKVGSKMGKAEAPPSSGVKQKSDEDAAKVPHTDKLPPNEEASDSDVGISTSAKYSSYSGYPTDDLGKARIVGLRWARDKPLVKVDMGNGCVVESGWKDAKVDCPQALARYVIDNSSGRKSPRNTPGSDMWNWAKKHLHHHR